MLVLQSVNQQKEKDIMKKTLFVMFVVIGAVLFCSCSHNPAALVLGRQIKLGTAEYGDLTYLNGFSLVDCSRENSEWQIDINDSDGISFDPATQTLKGVKSIRRRIGKQVTGYLNDLAENSPEAAIEYLKGDAMFAIASQNKAEVKEDTTFVKILKSLSSKGTGGKLIDCPDGNCHLTFNDKTVAYQLEIAKELLERDGWLDPNEPKPEGEFDESKYKNTVDLKKRCLILQGYGKETTLVYITEVTVKDNKVTDIVFMRENTEDGKPVRTQCVSCVTLDELDEDDFAK